MKYDFWNNPIVVSAFRVKYRRGGFSSTVVLYLLLLMVGGGVMQYYNWAIGPNWERKYFIAVMALQFVISVFFGCISTAASVRAEIVNRTLDFQRIATLSPRQILVGKLLGEPALAYLLAIASIPIGFSCYLMGGVSFEILILMYINLATTTLMAGAFGLAMRLEPPQGKTNAQMGGGEGAVFGILFGCATVGPIFYGLIANDIWKAPLPFFGFQVPFIFIVPFVQMALAILPFQIMVRLLVHPNNTMLSKLSAYVTLILIDLFAAAVLLDSTVAGWSVIRSWHFGTRTAAFFLAHLLASSILMSLITPRAEIVDSWAWRFRRRTHWLKDWLIGERSPNAWAIAVCATLGVVDWLLFVRLPTFLSHPDQLAWEFDRVAWSVVICSVVMTLSVGTFFQITNFLPGKRRVIMTNLVNLAIFLPYLLGKLHQYIPVDLILQLSPIDQFRHWLNPGLEPLNIGPLLLVYGLGFLGSVAALRLRLNKMQNVIQGKLQTMGVQST